MRRFPARRQKKEISEELFKYKFMKRFILVIVLMIGFFQSMYSQIPYFAPTVGDQNLYGYTSLKFRPGVNAQETYTTFQYGIGNLIATGLDLYTSGRSVYGGILARFGYSFSKWIKAGIQITPSFEISNNMKFSYLTNALYLNGNITDNGKFFWTANTWYTVNKGAKNTISQYLYLGYSFNLPKDQMITPMIGTIYSWQFDKKADLTFGAYWTVKKYNFYLWTNDILEKHPRVIVGVDFAFNASK